MKISELIDLPSKNQLDEVLPVAAALGGAALRGAAGTAARAIGGANNATKLAKTANSLNQLIGDDPQQQAKQDSKLKSTLSRLKNTLGAAGGPPIDVNRTAQTLTKPPTGKPDPASAKNLEPLLPALSQALQHSQSTDQIAQAIQTGVKTDIEQRSKAEQDRAKQIAKDVKANLR